MARRSPLCSLLFLAACCAIASCAPQAGETQEPPSMSMPSRANVPPAPHASSDSPAHAALDFTVNRIDGQPVNLAEQYAGKVVLIVNVASKCGYTPQYAALQRLHEKYRDHPGGGLAILGFPANEFGNQEPGTNEQIAQFCEENFGVTFDMFSKVVVKGEGIHPLFAHVTSEESTAGLPEDASGEIRWNFEKFLIDREGRLVNRFRSRTAPDSPEMIAAIEAALGE